MVISVAVQEPWKPTSFASIGASVRLASTTYDSRQQTTTSPIRARCASGTGPNQPAATASARVATHAAAPSTSVQAASTSSTAPGWVCR